MKLGLSAQPKQPNNVAVFRGTRLDGQTYAIVFAEGRDVRYKITTRVMRFEDIVDKDLERMGSGIRDTTDLLNALRRTYRNFDRRELVTIVEFWSE